ETGAEVGALVGHKDHVSNVTLTAGGETAVSASWDRTIKLWDLNRFALLASLRCASGTSIAVTPDGQRVIFAPNRDKGTLQIRRFANRGPHFTLTRHGSGVSAIVVTPDGTESVSASIDGTLIIWNLHSGAKRLLVGHQGRVSGVAVSRDGTKIFSASNDCSIKVWDRQSGELLRTLDNGDPVYGFVLAPDSGRGFSISSNCRLRVWDLGTNAMIAEFSCDATINALGASLDGRVIVAGDDSGVVHFLRIEGLAGEER